MQEIRYPDYDNSILNLITSILKHYKVETNHTSLKKLDKLLEKNYKNVVFIVLDGMGEHILNNISKDGFFKKHELDCITSVYPSTTTAALTTYYSGKPPYESGWIAWSQYFKEYGRAINVLQHKESYQNDTLENNTMDIYTNTINYEPIFSRIEKASPDVKAYEIMPDYSDKRSNLTLRANDVPSICENIKTLCSSDGQKFIMAYCDNPDGLLHKFGCTSCEAKDMVLEAEANIENLCHDLKDTLVIISADHGHKDINKVYNIIDYPEIQDCLIMPPSFEPRVLSFWVKENKKEKFQELFNKEFSNDFILLTKEEFLDKHFLGYGNKHKKIDDFVGNFIALSVSDAVIKIETYLAPNTDKKKSTHCGLTKDEMEVPLIIIENK